VNWDGEREKEEKEKKKEKKRHFNVRTVFQHTPVYLNFAIL